MDPQTIIAKIQAAIADAQVELEDLTGTKDHWQATVTSRAFIGKSLIERHRMVFAALEKELKGPIHALSLKVLTPGEWGSV